MWMSISQMRNHLRCMLQATLLYSVPPRFCLGCKKSLMSFQKFHSISMRISDIMSAKLISKQLLAYLDISLRAMRNSNGKRGYQYKTHYQRKLRNILILWYFNITIRFLKMNRIRRLQRKHWNALEKCVKNQDLDQQLIKLNQLLNTSCNSQTRKLFVRLKIRTPKEKQMVKMVKILKMRKPTTQKKMTRKTSIMMRSFQAMLQM